MERVRFKRIQIPTETGTCVVKVAQSLPLDHPVVKGVLAAVHILGSVMPDSVGQIQIRPEIITHRGQHLGLGVCDWDWGGGDRSDIIKIYAGSIYRWAGGQEWNMDIQAQETLLHEIGHSDHARETAHGLHFGREVLDKEQVAEAKAREFVRAYRDRQPPPRTWNDVLKQRRASQDLT